MGLRIEEITPYTRPEIQARAGYFGRLVELEIRGKDHQQIATELGSEPKTVAEELRRITHTIQTSPDDFEIIWDDLRLPERFNWQVTTKGMNLLRPK